MQSLTVTVETSATMHLRTTLSGVQSVPIWWESRAADEWQDILADNILHLVGTPQSYIAVASVMLGL